MAKDPAFLFYPNDWLGGTMGMTFEEKGAYMQLLMLQFNRGHMTTHMIAQEVGHLWERLVNKFTQDQEGAWYNKRLEEEQSKRRSYSESRRNNMAGLNQHSKKLNGQPQFNAHMTTHMENEVENVNVSVEGKNLNDLQKLKRFEIVSRELNSSELWQTSVSTMIKKSPDVVKKYVDEFLMQIKVSEAYTRPISEIKRHFGNWVKKQIQPEVDKFTTKTQNYPTI